MVSDDNFKVRQQRVKLNEIEKTVLCNLGFLASCLVSFLMSENCAFILLGF